VSGFRNFKKKCVSVISTSKAKAIMLTTELTTTHTAGIDTS